MSLRRYSHGAGPLRVSVSADRSGAMYLLRQVPQRLRLQEEAWCDVKNDDKTVCSKLLTDAAHRQKRMTLHAARLSVHVGWASRHNGGCLGVIDKGRPLLSASGARSLAVRPSSRLSAIWSWLTANAIKRLKTI